MQPVYFFVDAECQAMEKATQRHNMLTAWFELNRTDPDANRYLYAPGCRWHRSRDLNRGSLLRSHLPLTSCDGMRPVGAASRIGGYHVTPCNAFLGKGNKQGMLQLAEELGVNVTSNVTVPSIKIAFTNSENYEEEIVKDLFGTIMANRKMEAELERAETVRLVEHALKEKELKLKFDLESFKVETGVSV
ncbi:hypothetical protein TNIN_285081 [Trichonephila inaurata madagascariensis]|uniref:Uncharacterized protein n=1 Tax=Trichonephila inaurata madagascariensis TaxID=2747483 RepID=A0A8X6X9J3_9ARAC|nr:hypothetical protein TNIN_285081 [Trichonephila inaurata madagascariensis]